MGGVADAQSRGKRSNQAIIDEQIGLLRATQGGGVVNCFDPRITGRARVVLERSGGVPCRKAPQPGAASSGQSAAGRAASSSWIVGAWIDRGSDCAGDTGITFARDGSYSTDSESGRWSLSGEVLIYTALETYSLGDPGSERRLRQPRSVTNRILSHTGRSMVMRDQRGRNWPMVKCP